MTYRNLAQGLATPVVAFDGDRLLLRGRAEEVALALKRLVEAGAAGAVLVFDDATSRPAEIDYAGSDEDVLAFVESWGRLRGPKRPVEREVTLLPRHWAWLDAQPAGASAALRRLVEAAMRSPEEAARAATEGAYRFILTMAGDREGFEAAARALFAGDAAEFAAATEEWPPDVRAYARELMARGNKEGAKEDR